MPMNGIVTDYDDNGYPLPARATAPITWNGIGIGAPAAPSTSTATSGGTIAAGTYQVVTTYVNAAGESIASASASQVTTGSTSTITVTSPAASGGATGWYAYVTQVGGSTYTRQQAAGTPTAIGSGLTLTAPPTSTGAAPPSANTTGGTLRTVAGRLARVTVTTALAGSGSQLALYDSAAGQPATPLLVIPVAAGTAGSVFPVDMPAAAGITAIGSLLTAGAVTVGYS